jgi:hypothetical protein
MGQVEEILGAGMRAAWEEYWRAKSGAADPVILLCTTGVYRTVGPGEADPKLPRLEAAAGAIRGNPFVVVVDSHEHMYQGLCKLSFQEALRLGPRPDPENPFVIVVMTERGTRVFRFKESHGGPPPA